MSIEKVIKVEAAGDPATGSIVVGLWRSQLEGMSIALDPSTAADQCQELLAALLTHPESTHHQKVLQWIGPNRFRTLPLGAGAVQMEVMLHNGMICMLPLPIADAEQLAAQLQNSIQFAKSPPPAQ